MGRIGMVVGKHPARRRIQTDKVDAGRLSHNASPTVTTNEVLRPQRSAVGQLDVDARVAVSEAGHLAFANDRHRQSSWSFICPLRTPAHQDAVRTHQARTPMWRALSARRL